MNLEQFVKYLEVAGADANTIQFAVNCYVQGQADLRKHLADELQKQPLNDTAQSIAIWIRGQH